MFSPAILSFWTPNVSELSTHTTELRTHLRHFPRGTERRTTCLENFWYFLYTQTSFFCPNAQSSLKYCIDKLSFCLSYIHTEVYTHLIFLSTSCKRCWCQCSVPSKVTTVHAFKYKYYFTASFFGMYNTWCTQLSELYLQYKLHQLWTIWSLQLHTRYILRVRSTVAPAK